MMDTKQLTRKELIWIDEAFRVALAQPCCKQSIVELAVSNRLTAPKVIQVGLADFRAPLVGLPEGVYSVWLVIEDSPQSVFYDPATKKFGACFGPEIQSGEYTDWGFRSEDPLEMYIA